MTITDVLKNSSPTEIVTVYVVTYGLMTFVGIFYASIFFVGYGIGYLIFPKKNIYDNSKY